jgi:hypothetical protein
MSCDQAQGYFYSRPLRMADMHDFSPRARKDCGTVKPHNTERDMIALLGSLAGA